MISAPFFLGPVFRTFTSGPRLASGVKQEGLGPKTMLSLALARRASILTVEDNPADLFLIRMVLAGYGLQVDLCHAADGENAIQLLSGMEPPDLILLDLSLPRMNGMEVLKQLRMDERLAQVPIAILTSSDSAKDRGSAERSGASKYVLKMNTFDEFRDAIWTSVNELLGRTLCTQA